MSLKDLLYKDTKPKGILISVEGHQKTGKTRFALTLPDPVAVLNLNFGLSGVIEPFIRAGKRFYVKDILVPLTKELPGQSFTILATAAAEKWREAITFLREAMADEEVRSLFIDTGGELWDLLRIARLGKLAQVMPIQYAAVNAEFRQLLQLLLTSGKNVVLSHKIKPEYVNDQKTNRFERAGFGDVGYDVQLELRTERDMKAIGDDQFTMTYLDCRADKNAKGTVLKGADCTFLNVVQRVYPETTEADWI